MGPTNQTLINAQDATATQVSAAISARLFVYGSIQASFTANDAAGTLSFQASDDVPTGTAGFAPVNWNDIPNATATVASGATKIIPTQTLAYAWVRAKWVPSGGGAGTITCTGFFFGI